MPLPCHAHSGPILTGFLPPLRFWTWAGSCVRLGSSASLEDSSNSSSSECSTLGTGGMASRPDMTSMAMAQRGDQHASSWRVSHAISLRPGGLVVPNGRCGSCPALDQPTVPQMRQGPSDEEARLLGGPERMREAAGRIDRGIQRCSRGCTEGYGSENSEVREIPA